MDTLREKIHQADESVRSAIEAINQACPLAGAATFVHLAEVLPPLQKAAVRLTQAWLAAEAEGKGVRADG